MVILPQTSQETPPTRKRPKLDHIQILEDQSQLGIEHYAVMSHNVYCYTMSNCSNGEVCAFWNSTDRDVSATGSSYHHRG